MAISPLAGRPAPASILVDLPRLISAYYTQGPDPDVASQAVAFGTSGHRGSSFRQSFNEAHILAITQAICEYRAAQGINGPLYLGKDTHGLSEPALRTAIEVLAANEVEVRVELDGYVPTPALSHAILTHNHRRKTALADGIVITPSHNPPEDGGFKYNPPHGGPAGGEVTRVIEHRANALLRGQNAEVKRVLYPLAVKAAHVQRFDFVTPYVATLDQVVDLRAIASRKLRVGIDPMGGAAVAYWSVIAERYGLDLTVVNPSVDATYRFMTVDKDGKIRMDCSSPYAMATLVGLKDRYDIAFGNDADSDRHGIVAPSVGLLNPNHYLAVAISYLFANRTRWRPDAAVGKTLVSSSIIDRVAKMLGKKLAEVPVGFKWFVDGLIDGSFGFGGEESAGASFLRLDGSVWTTDKDGLLLNLLAAEITAKTGKDPGVLYRELTEKLGNPVYERVDAPATPEQKKKLAKLSASSVTATELAGEKIVAKMTTAPYNQAPIGGLKVATENGWFAARPSGTENVYKIYAESFLGNEHLSRIQEEARAIVDKAL